MLPELPGCVTMLCPMMRTCRRATARIVLGCGALRDSRPDRWKVLAAEDIAVAILARVCYAYSGHVQDPWHLGTAISSIARVWLERGGLMAPALRCCLSEIVREQHGGTVRGTPPAQHAANTLSDSKVTVAYGHLHCQCTAGGTCCS